MMDDLTLIGFRDRKSDDGFGEFYATRDGGLFLFKNGRWFDGDAEPVRGPKHLLNLARDQSLSQGYYRWLSTQPPDTTDLERYILPELAQIISHYLAALKPYPIPLPPDDIGDRFRHVFNMDGMCSKGEIYPELRVTNEYHVEFWKTSDLAEYIYLGTSQGNGIGLWNQDLDDCQDGSITCPTLHNLLLSTRRRQILGLPLR